MTTYIPDWGEVMAPPSQLDPNKIVGEPVKLSERQLAFQKRRRECRQREEARYKSKQSIAREKIKEAFMSYIDEFLQEGLKKYAEDHDYEYRIGTQEIFHLILNKPMPPSGSIFLRALRIRMTNLEWEAKPQIQLRSRHGRMGTGYTLRKLDNFMADFLDFEGF